MDRKRSLFLCVALCGLCACSWVDRVKDATAELFGDETVARVGDRKLFRSELDRYIPAGVSPEDSASLAAQYINTWATDLIYLETAEAQLSKEEKDVADELEDYRRSLLKYRYEQHYVNERLDTAISPAAIRVYYDAHPEKFALDAPIARVRVMLIPENAKNLQKIKKLMSSDKVDDVLAADSLARSSALKYADRSEQWTSVMDLAREFGTDPESLLGSVRRGFVERPDGNGNLRVAYLVELLKAGRTAPVEYCAADIREIILSTRKHALLEGLERELLKDARSRDRFVVYSNER